MRNLSLAVGCLLFVALASAAPVTKVSPPKDKEKPKLVLLIVLDQFRGDYLTRFESRFLPSTSATGDVGGFRYLTSKGAFYPFGQYDILQCMTGPGHSTTLSGAYPYQSGIAGNNWYDAKSDQRVYCVEDPKVATVGAEIKDPHVGTSPKNFLATTVGDELKNAGHPSRVVSVAIKDRAAILMGGHRADLAFWLDSNSFHWVSSQFYLPNGSLPDWLSQMNKELDAKKGEVVTWNATTGPSGLSQTKNILPPSIEKEQKEFGDRFPHKYTLGSNDSLASPYGIDITEQAAERAAEAFKLGRGKATDLLAVSFSSHDYVGHAFGPNSLEMEEMTVLEDKAVANLLNYLRKKVPGGLKNVLVVLTADHGIPPNPDWLQKERVPAGRIDEKKLAEELSDALTAHFGKPHSKWFAQVRDFNFYFEAKNLEEMKLSRTLVEEKLKSLLLAKRESVAQAFSFTDFAQRKLPPGLFERQILKTYFPGRSGDVILIPRPFFMPTGETVTHTTGYNYDRIVPILFAGPRIKPGTYSTPGEVVDIAPTLSFLLGILPPSLSEGRVLSEIITN